MFAGALYSVNAVTFVYAAFVPLCGKWKGGYMKALKIDLSSALFFFKIIYFKMGKNVTYKTK